jgi:hypothetical protein
MESSSLVLWTRHIVANPIIDVTGTRARCQWYMWLPKITNNGTSRAFQGGTHFDQCCCVNGQWLFEHLQVRLRKLP